MAKITVQEFYIGDVAYLAIDPNSGVEVRIKAIVPSYGRMRYVVEPVKGYGELTVEKLEKIK